MKYRVTEKFRDKYTKREYPPGKMIDLDAERAGEIIMNLGEGYISEITLPSDKDLAALDAETLTSLKADELKALAARLGVKLAHTDNTKAEIAARIVDAREPPEPDAAEDGEV
jgi:hypothetical protein